MERSKVALVVLDPQVAFTDGVWMRSLRSEEILPIVNAFEQCGKVISQISQMNVPILLSRCPFPGNSFDFHPCIQDSESFFNVIKPGNNIMNALGFQQWVEKEVLGKNITHLMFGGCTTTSCIRVSAQKTFEKFHRRGLSVCVDMAMCGARGSNYIARCPKCLEIYLHFGIKQNCNDCAASKNLKSPVDIACEDMRKTGVIVHDRFDWESLV